MKCGLLTYYCLVYARAIAENPDANNVVRAGELKQVRLTYSLSPSIPAKYSLKLALLTHLQMSSINLTIGVALPESDSVISAKVPDADKLSIIEIAQKIKKDVRMRALRTHI